MEEVSMTLHAILVFSSRELLMVDNRLQTAAYTMCQKFNFFFCTKTSSNGLSSVTVWNSIFIRTGDMAVVRAGIAMQVMQTDTSCLLSSSSPFLVL
jgi:hypothetical protein